MFGVSQWKCSITQLADVINTIGELGGTCIETWEEDGVIHMTIQFEDRTNEEM